MRPDQHSDGRGGRHTTHTPFKLSDSTMSEDIDIAEIYEGWGFDPDPDEPDFRYEDDDE